MPDMDGFEFTKLGVLDPIKALGYFEQILKGIEICRKTTIYDSRNLKSAFATTQYTKPGTAQRREFEVNIKTVNTSVANSVDRERI